MVSPKVIYSIATALGGHGLGQVSYNAVKALHEAGLLKRAVTYGNTSDVPPSKVLALPGNPAKLLFFLPKRRYRPMRKGFLDFVTSKLVLGGCSVFHGWNNQARRSIEAAKKVGAKTVLECGSTYTTYKETLLEEEYRRFGLVREKAPEYAIRSSLLEFEMADFIFLPSEFAKRTFIGAGFASTRLFVIERAVDAERYRPAGGKGKKFRVIFVGRVSLRKGVQYLLEAWEKVKITDSELLIVGGIDENMKPLLARYADMDNVVFTGHIKDTSKVYGEASVFVFPSLEEGSAKVTYEAMASGLPVVTTENSGSVVRDGVDGFIVPIKDAKAIREKIVQLYEDPDRAAAMGLSGRERANLYTWRRYRETMLDIYRRAVLP